MCAWLKFVLFLPLIGTTQGNHQNVSTTSNFLTNNVCNKTVLKEIEECWARLSSVSVHGIPSSPKRVEETCSIFNKGMECFNYWSNTCLSNEGQEQLGNAIIGAVQIYKFLCTDKKFQEDYLKHSHCYERISFYWNDCNNKFSNAIKHVNMLKDALGFCCIRHRYIKCVDDMTIALCSKAATQFLEYITETLMHSPLDHHYSYLCSNVDIKKCSSSSSNVPHNIFFGVMGIPFPNYVISFLSKWILTLFEQN